MPFFLIILLAQIAFGVFCAVFGLMLAVEYLPVLGAKAIAVSDGTSVEYLGHLIAQFCEFAAKIAQQMLGMLYGFLKGFGVDVDKLKSLSEQSIDVMKQAGEEAMKNSPKSVKI